MIRLYHFRKPLLKQAILPAMSIGLMVGAAAATALLAFSATIGVTCAIAIPAAIVTALVALLCIATYRDVRNQRNEINNIDNTDTEPQRA